MQEVFEKILDRLENLGWVFADYYPDGTNISRVRESEKHEYRKSMCNI